MTISLKLFTGMFVMDHPLPPLSSCIVPKREYWHQILFAHLRVKLARMVGMICMIGGYDCTIQFFSKISN